MSFVLLFSFENVSNQHHALRKERFKYALQIYCIGGSCTLGRVSHTYGITSGLREFAPSKRGAPYQLHLCHDQQEHLFRAASLVSGAVRPSEIFGTRQNSSQPNVCDNRALASPISTSVHEASPRKLFVSRVLLRT